jgi:hypothetical protein
MKDPDYPTEQPKDPVADALTDRNSDPDAQAEPVELKKTSETVLNSSEVRDPDQAATQRRDEPA